MPLDKAECLRLLTTVAVSRIGFVGDDGPDILPVNHVVVDERVYFRTGPGTKLGAAAADEAVALEADDFHAPEEQGWSVVVKGVARIVTDDDRLEALHSLNFEPWAAPDTRTFWVEVEARVVTGRRLVGA